jgi:hypothetical protein
VRGQSLDLLDQLPLRDGEEVVITISKEGPVKDLDALRRAAGAWKGLVDADALIANIYVRYRQIGVKCPQAIFIFLDPLQRESRIRRCSGREAWSLRTLHWNPRMYRTKAAPC